MEIPEINMLSEFEARMKCLQNPSFISRFSPFPSFWKWGALILAFFATFSSVIRRINLISIHFHTSKSSSNKTVDVFEFSDDDDLSLASSDDELEEEENDSPATSFGDQHRVDEDFCVRGSLLGFKSQGQNRQLTQRSRRSSGGAWSDFGCGKNVVKLWDTLGFSLDFDEDLFNYDPKNVVSTWSFDREGVSSGFSGGVWDVPATAPTVLLTAERNRKGDGVVLSGYDSRMRSRVPALCAEWRLPAEKIAGILTAGVGNVYVKDDVSGVITVGDVRNVTRPLAVLGEALTPLLW